ncbi:fumarylacetoacetate hydrolase family protein [Ureibacillus chungkukjangi]|uniref:2-keto-4-pentenoate hydratase/2-oxohepta-3-ene-1,7-dioic acid hydratase in catechol pathway n=1 Tax=Ureibacillus chungkukjangi TaxID=1202712 RepID=A0A318TXM9_9BACL|nr:fumarylacetoacetate hydrolase family protein [Ureibacillus chungkukjangi]PYF08517.1 2-keto-4-pentenoate hydratase/2-oxohepta-3-ene-1,7-dioic acid hydratase in catechol pathway [Ureibacillus chungkukjangi]
MNLATINYENSEQPVLLLENGAVLIKSINEHTGIELPLTMEGLVERGAVAALKQAVAGLVETDWIDIHKLEIEELSFVAPYRNPQHIFGVGMNYVEKAIDLEATQIEDAPVCFMKPASSLIGMNELIELPKFSKIVTAEGELCLIIGKTCHEVSPEEAMPYVSGYTTSLDLTAKDIHAQNPRFVQISKVFKSFFSFGPQIKLLDGKERLTELVVQSIHNGEVAAENAVSNMMYTPEFIVSYISQFVILQPGDLIMTGTPGSYVLQSGDEAGCAITGLLDLKNRVL